MAELRIPVASDYSSPLEYAQAIIKAQVEYRDACFRQIDRVADKSDSTDKSKNGRVPAMQTAHDFLADHPYMRERFKQLGPMAFLEPIE